MRARPDITLVMISPTRDADVTTDDLVSGAEVRIFHFIRYCDRQGIKIHMITNTYGQKMFRKRINSEISVARAPHFIERNPRLDVLKTFLIIPLSAIKYVITSKSMIVVGATSLFPDALVVSLSRMFSRKTWTYFHHRVETLNAKGLLSQIMQQLSLFVLLISRTNFFVLSSAKSFIGHIIPVRRIFEFENGVDNSLVKRSSSGKFSDVDVLYIGRVSVRKGSDDLIEIWKRVKRIDPTRKLTIAGPIEDKNFLSKVAKTGPSIAVLGQVTEDKKLSLLRAAKCFISASREEGWGMSISEALAFGLPVVAYALPAYDYAGKSIIRIPIGRYDEFAQCIVSLRKHEVIRPSIKDWNDALKSELSVILSFGK